MAKHNDLGKWGEDLATAFLRKKGYVIVDRNWYFGKIDLDIVALSEDNRFLVFVEVKTRTQTLVSPLAAVDEKKIRNLQRAAHHYVKQTPLTAWPRFDIITVVGENTDNVQIEHIEDAFNPLLL